MRPLAEGMALFGEFDVTPGNSAVISQVMLTAAISFLELSNQPDETTVAQAGTLFGSALMTARLRPRFRNRKANLLVRPLTLDDGGYLAGYLTVKNCWHHFRSIAGVSKFADTDLFLTYLRSFFYDDFGLVAVLLDPDKEIASVGAGPIDSAEAISRYLQERFLRLAEFTTPAAIDEFETAMVAKEDPMVPPTAIGSDPALAARGKDLLDGMIKELDFDGPPDSLEKRLLRAHHWLVAQRDLMCVGSFDAPIRVNGHKRVLVTAPATATSQFSPPIFSFKAIADASPAQGEGSVEFFLSPAGHYSVLTVTLDDRVVAVESGSPNLTSDLREQVAEYRASLTAAQEERKVWRAIVDAMLDELAASDDYLSHYRQNNRRVAEAIYFPKALLFTTDPHLDAAIEQLRADGLYTVLGTDFDLIRGAAALSLVGSFNNTIRTAREWLAESNINVDSVIELLSRMRVASPGITLFEQDNGAFFCFF
jgi:hypothetical protein